MKVSSNFLLYKLLTVITCSIKFSIFSIGHGNISRKALWLDNGYKAFDMP